MRAIYGGRNLRTAREEPSVQPLGRLRYTARRLVALGLVALLGAGLLAPAPVGAQQGSGGGSSSDAGLSGLSLSPVGLHPPVFVSSDTDYQAWAPYSVTSVQVTATARHGTESLTVNGNAATSGQPSGPVALEVGSNLITVVATSSDGQTSVSYTITVTRATEAQQSDASLSVVSVYRTTSIQPDSNNDVSFRGDPLTLTPTLSDTVREYRAELPEADGPYVAVAVTPAAGGAKEITMQGPLPPGEQREPKGKVAAGEAGGPWHVKIGHTLITIEVTSLDGTSTETYRLIIKRGTVDDPKGLRVTPGDGQLTVHWDASDSPTAPNLYQARWRKSGETKWLNPATHAGDEMLFLEGTPLGTVADGGPRTFASQGSRTVTGLDNGTAYEVQVRAIRGDAAQFKVIDWLASDWHSLTATPAAPRTALAITPTRPTRPYGGTDDLSFTVTGLTEGDTAANVITGALARTAGDDAGTYTIGMGTLAIASAYTAKYELPTAPTVTAYEITPLTIPSITGVTVASRDADGTTAATFDTSAAVGTSVLAAELDDFRAGGLVVSGQFPSATAGTHSVAVTYSLRDQGAFKAANYSLLSATATLTGELTTAAEIQPACTPAVNGDYDRDDDGLIEVCDLAQLNAIRFDNNGDAKPERGTTGEYTAAFPGIISGGPGCPIRCKGYELVVDLDLDTNGNGRADADDRYWNDGLGWAPMPISNHHFVATFEGNGHTISGLFMDKPANMHRVGLFGTIGGGANVRNLILDSVEVRDGGHMVAGLVGHNQGTISNVHVSGTVTGGYQDVGLLAGENRGRIADSSATGTVAADNDVGILVGENHKDVVRSNASGAATGRYSVGGLVGKQLGARSTIIGSSAVATVTGTTSASGGGRWIGGLVGDNDGKIRTSMARATVTGSASAVGGLVGRNTGNVLATYAQGSVNSTGSHVGGLVGQNNSYLKASYSVARTDGGGLVGSGSGTVTDSYWDTVASGATTSAAGTGQTTAALTAPSGYTGIYEDWNVDVDGDGRADSPWRFPAGGAYPLLRQLPASASSALTGSILLTAAADPAGDDASDLELVSVSLPASVTISPALASDQSAYTITLPPYMAQVSLFGSFSDPSTAGYAYLAAAADLADFEALGVNTANEHLLAQLSGGVVGAYETTLEGGESHTVQVGVYKWKPDESNQAPFADHTLKRTYTLTITRAQYPTDDAGLSHLSVSPGQIPFDPDTLSYRLDVASTISSITVTPRTSSPHATVTVAGEDPDTPVALSPGENHIDVVVTAEDGETTSTYRVTVSRARETKIRFTAVLDVTAEGTDDMWITGLALPEGFTITPAFSPDQLDYQVIAPVEWDRVEVIGDYTTPYNRNGEGHYERTAYIFAASSLEEVGENWGDTWRERKTWPGQSQRTRGFLDSLHWDYHDGAFFHLTPGEATDIALVLHKWDRFKWAREGQARIRPLLENSITKTYTLTVTRGMPDDDDARLDRLGTSAGPVALKDGLTEYALKVANSVTSLTVTPRPLHPSATVTVDGSSADTPVALEYGANAISVVVTAVDGTTTKTYTLTVTRALPAAPGRPATMVVAPGHESATLKWFAPGSGVEYYEMRVRDSEGSVVDTSTVDDSDLASPLKSFTFSGLTAGAEYTFGLRAGNAGGTSAWVDETETIPVPTELKWLQASARIGNGNTGPLFQFRRGTTSYRARQSMMEARIAQVQVRAETYDPQATVTINGESGATQSVDLSYGENLITVVVSAPGETSTTYTIALMRPPVAQLEGLQLQTITRGGSGGNAQLAQSFAGWRTAYTVEVAREVIGLRVQPTVTTPKTATINGKPANVNANTYVSLQRGKTNNIAIVVTQGANSTTYTVAVTVEGGNSTPTVAAAIADISGLEPDDTQNVSLTGVFTDADNDPLTIEAESSATAVATVSVASDGASLTVTAVKAGTATITVTADDGNDGTVSDTFDVTVDEPNNAPTVASALGDISGLAPDDSRQVSLAGVFTDADSDTLTISVGSSKNAVAVAAVNATHTALTVRAVGEGTATITVTADDGNGGTVSDTFDVTVELANAHATVASALADISGLNPDDTRQVSLSGVFDDPDGDTLTITATSSATAVATVSVATGGASLTVTAVKVGTATITVTADDGNGGTASDTFDVTVTAAANNAPTVASAIANISRLEPDESRQVRLDRAFNDADGDTLTIEAESSDDAVATVSVASGYGSLTVRALEAGTATITVTADDGNGGTVSDTFTVTVAAANSAPAVVSAIADISDLEPEDSRQVSLAGVFDDADGDTLTITVRSWNTTVATVTVASDSGSLTVTAVGEGTAAITVTAQDSNGARVTDRFTITVGTPEADEGDPEDALEEEDVVARYDFNKDGIIQKSEFHAAVADLGNGVDYLDLVKIRAAWAAGGFQQ